MDESPIKVREMQQWTEKIDEFRKKLSNFKVSLWEEYLPLLFIAWIYSVPLGYLYWPPLMIFLCFKWRGWIIIWILYYFWIWYDSSTLKRAGRKIHQLKYLLAFESVGQYFPIRLIKTADLPADRNYLFACYPHGIIPHGVLGNFVTNFTKFTQLFPDIEVHMATLALMFKLPLIRECIMALGACVASDESIKYWLSCEPSQAVILLPGGVKEMLLSHSGNEYKIVQHRKGFIRIALQTGAFLVPVFTFGEHNTQDQEEYRTGIVRFIMNLLYKYTGLKLNRIVGRGIFQKNFGILPHRRPITTVVGKPIPIPKVVNPTAAVIDEYHEKYFNALYELFESNKYIHDEAGSSAKLIMV